MEEDPEPPPVTEMAQTECLLPPKSESSSPTPAGSSAGASSPAIPANIASIDWCGSGKGAKGGSLSRNGSKPSQVAGGSTSNAGASPPLCRPWDKGDLLGRLATFKSSNWSAGKPKVASPVACARRGWVIVDVDVISCEACGARLSLSISSSWSQHEVEEAAKIFSEQLDSNHKALCPWKGNPCAESLVQFPLPQFSALVESYYDRCDALLQLTTLPVIAGCAIDQMKLMRGSGVSWLLSQPPSFLGGRELGQKRESPPAMEVSTQSANDSYYQAQCLISLCGWEPRFISNMPDCEEHSAHSAQNGRPVGLGKSSSCKVSDAGPSMLSRSRASKPEKKVSGQSMVMVSESKGSVASVVLDCNLCGASVALLDFLSCLRTIPSSGSTLVEMPERGLKAIMRGASAASGIDCWGAAEAPLKLKQQEPGDEAGDGVVTGEKNGPLDLNLTIAGGIPSTVFGSTAVPHLAASELAGDWQLCLGQPEGSDVGFPAASYESFGPRTQRACHGDSAEGTIVDGDGDEVRGRSSFVGESSRSKRPRESFGADPGCSYLMPPEVDLEADVSADQAKKPKSELLAVKDSCELRLWSPFVTRDSVYASSVIAVDTSYSKQENSMESVENAPQESDGMGAAISHDEKSGRTDLEVLNLLDRAQQSTCQAGEVRRRRGGADDGSELALSASNEGELATNERGGGGGFSLGVSGGSVHMCASHEAEMRGGGAAEASMHRTESIAGNAELIAENQRQTSESALDQAFTGEFASEPVDTPLGYSLDAPPSPCAANANASKNDDSVQGESWASEGKGSRAFAGDQTTDKTVALTHGGENYSTGALAIEQEVVGALSVATNQEGEEGSGDKKKGEQRYFDPIKYHCHFCPWVNGHVASAGDVGGSFVAALCGWQLTLDALYAFQMEEQTPALPMESESAASMHKGEHSGRRILGSKLKAAANQGGLHI